MVWYRYLPMVSYLYLLFCSTLTNPLPICSDIDECAVPGSCSQHCTNTPGGFSCSCLAGYRPDPQDTTRCRADRAGGRLALLYAHRTDIRLADLRRQEMVTVVERTRSAVGLDFHYAAGLLFWSDSLEGRIYRVKMTEEQRISGGKNSSGSTGRRVVVDHGADDDGLAVDWINDNLYFVRTLKADGDRRRAIAVTDFAGRVVVDLIEAAADLDKPRALVLQPERGRLYWSDWGHRPRIETAGLDGTGRQTLVQGDGIVWPNGLALDLVGERLYWVDAKLHRLSSVSTQGGAVHVVLESFQHLHHPFGLAVFEDWLYWTEWGRNTSAIYRASKFTGEQLSQFKQSNMVSGGGYIICSVPVPVGTCVDFRKLGGISKSAEQLRSTKFGTVELKC